MTVTNAWSEDKPEGSEAANLADNYLREHRVDLGDRLKEMLYGFNTDSNTAPENESGVKKLKCYPQATAPTTDSSYGFIYCKTVNGVIELFYKDGNGTEKQITTAGKINVIAADLVATGVVLTTTDQTVAGTKTLSAFPISPSIAPSSDYQFANKKYVDDTVSAITDPAYTGGESHTFDGGLIIKHGSVTGAQSSDRTVSFAVAFPNSCLNVQLLPQSAAAAGHSGNLQLISMAADNFHFVQPNGTAAYNLVYWVAIGY